MALSWFAIGAVAILAVAIVAFIAVLLLSGNRNSNHTE
jgi:hypothetical protein